MVEPTGSSYPLKQDISLTFSGGGIRSACFGSGVLEYLADHNQGQATNNQTSTTRFLERLASISTVSGGGYLIGSLFAHITHYTNIDRQSPDLNRIIKETVSKFMLDPSHFKTSIIFDGIPYFIMTIVYTLFRLFFILSIVLLVFDATIDIGTNNCDKTSPTCDFFGNEIINILYHNDKGSYNETLKLYHKDNVTFCGQPTIEKDNITYCPYYPFELNQISQMGPFLRSPNFIFFGTTEFDLSIIGISIDYFNTIVWHIPLLLSIACFIIIGPILSFSISTLEIFNQMLGDLIVLILVKLLFKVAKIIRESCKFLGHLFMAFCRIIKLICCCCRYSGTEDSSEQLSTTSSTSIWNYIFPPRNYPEVSREEQLLINPNNSSSINNKLGELIHQFRNYVNFNWKLRLIKSIIVVILVIIELFFWIQVIAFDLSILIIWSVGLSINYISLTGWYWIEIIPVIMIVIPVFFRSLTEFISLVLSRKIFQNLAVIALSISILLSTAMLSCTVILLRNKGSPIIFPFNMFNIIYEDSEDRPIKIYSTIMLIASLFTVIMTIPQLFHGSLRSYYRKSLFSGYRPSNSNDIKLTDIKDSIKVTDNVSNRIEWIANFTTHRHANAHSNPMYIGKFKYGFIRKNDMIGSNEKFDKKNYYQLHYNFTKNLPKPIYLSEVVAISGAASSTSLGSFESIFLDRLLLSFVDADWGDWIKISVGNRIADIFLLIIYSVNFILNPFIIMLLGIFIQFLNVIFLGGKEGEDLDKLGDHISLNSIFYLIFIYFLHVGSLQLINSNSNIITDNKIINYFSSIPHNQSLYDIINQNLKYIMVMILTVIIVFIIQLFLAIGLPYLLYRFSDDDREYQNNNIISILVYYLFPCIFFIMICYYFYVNKISQTEPVSHGYLFGFVNIILLILCFIPFSSFIIDFDYALLDPILNLYFIILAIVIVVICIIFVRAILKSCRVNSNRIDSIIGSYHSNIKALLEIMAYLTYSSINETLYYYMPLSNFKTLVWPQVFASDGGHLENLGILKPIMDLNRYVITVDAGYDPECSCSSLFEALSIIKLECNNELENFDIYLTDRITQESISINQFPDKLFQLNLKEELSNIPMLHFVYTFTLSKQSIIGKIVRMLQYYIEDSSLVGLDQIRRKIRYLLGLNLDAISDDIREKFRGMGDDGQLTEFKEIINIIDNTNPKINSEFIDRLINCFNSLDEKFFNKSFQGHLFYIKMIKPNRSSDGLITSFSSDPEFPNYPTSNQFLDRNSAMMLNRLGYETMKDCFVTINQVISMTDR